MIEVLMIVAVVVVLVKAADVENMSTWIWGAVAVGCSLAAIFLMPAWPLVRIAVAGVAAFVIMTGYRIATQR